MSFQQQAKRSTRQVTSGKKTGRSASVNVSDAPKAPMPHNVRPMLASPAEQPFDNPGRCFAASLHGGRQNDWGVDGGVVDMGVFVFSAQ